MRPSAWSRSKSWRVCLRYERIPLHLRYFCGSSPLSVWLALVNRRKFLDELVYHELTAQDHAWAFVWHGVMHNFLTFPLGLYFLLLAFPFFFLSISLTS